MERIVNIILGPRYQVRLEDLGKWDRFEARCSRCSHRAVVHPNPLRRRWPGYTRMLDLEKKLRCKRCGNRERNTLKTGRLTRD